MSRKYEYEYEDLYHQVLYKSRPICKEKVKHRWCSVRLRYKTSNTVDVCERCGVVRMYIGKEK